jgi:hypothetical protein
MPNRSQHSPIPPCLMHLSAFGGSVGDTEAVRASEGGMPYGRQITEEEQRQDRGGQVSQGKARR